MLEKKKTMAMRRCHLFCGDVIAKKVMTSCYHHLFNGDVEVKKATTACCRCLLFYVKEEEDYGNVSLSSSVVLLEQRR